MKRVTVTVPDDLEDKLAAFMASRGTPPSVTTVMQTALREFLQNHQLRERGFRPARKPLVMTALDENDPKGEVDVSLEHDRYFAETVQNNGR
jgi:hypothetical protein